mgnify:CR=1 FL=1
MNHQLGIPDVRRVLAFVFALVMAFALVATVANSPAEAKKKKKAKPVKVMVPKIITKNQQQLIKQKKLTIRVRSTGKANPRLESYVATGWPAAGSWGSRTRTLTTNTRNSRAANYTNPH